ncbi:hypothetical protein K0H71_10930 [Bacillus sp. IITD106]|nr:hypothetical protein [Bacillus sp. IITD106]
MGYGKGHIVIDFDERYKDYNEYIKTIKDELERKGHEVSYKGNGEFLINGKPYIFIERNVSVGGVPLQRTVLQPKKGYSKKSES